ncbi:MAG TPA: DUF6519 domain-containing protein [Steroidobacteraceae bacterium]
MKGDFSRIRFNPNQHYTSVLSQQGRVALDADANEQSAIDGYLRTTEAVDVIGEYGGPSHDAGFAINVSGEQITIGPGRYYVAGILCENASVLGYDQQPFLIDGTPSNELLEDLIATKSGTCLRTYLEVWQRLVTALDDPCLGEPALGQADTTARTQTVWRVIAELDTNAADATTDCCTSMYATPQNRHTGSLSAQTAPAGSDCGCQPIPAAGYLGLENQLYRVEVHQSGDESTATFKWSRENGSVVVAIQSVQGSQVSVASLGPDANLGFQVNQWVEISDDTNSFGPTPNQPGTLYQIRQIDVPSLTVTLSATVLGVDKNRRPRMRRWDQFGNTTATGAVALSGSWIALENGIQVTFGKGNYVAGDAWTIPARNATGQIDWPPCGGDGKAFQPPHYTQSYRAPLACVHAGALIKAGKTSRVLGRQPPKVDDCRRLFPSLTDLSALADTNALHVTGTNWSNDDAMTLDALIQKGLTVTFDQAPTSPVSPANFIVTLETPIVLAGGTSTNLANFSAVAGGAAAPASAPASAPAPAAPPGAAPATAPASAPAPASLAATRAATPAANLVATRATNASEAAVFANRTALETLDSAALFVILPTPTVMRSETVLDSTITATATAFTWNLPYQKVSTLQSRDLVAIDLALLAGMSYGWPRRVRVKLPGRTLFATTAATQTTRGGKPLYLDGQAFGQTAQTADGSRSRVDLQFPTGNGDRASDFESWFYLYPILSVSSLTVAYPALIAMDDGNAVQVYRAPLPQAPPYTPVNQQATLTLNYPPIAATQLNLTLGPNTNIASVPATMAVPAGTSAVTIPITFGGAPPVGTTQIFTLTVSLATALGTVQSQSATFTVNGQAPPVIIG